MIEEANRGAGPGPALAMAGARMAGDRLPCGQAGGDREVDMRYGLLRTVAAALLLLAGCIADTKNVGYDYHDPHPPTCIVSIPVDMAGGEEATWTVTWFGGLEPITISMDMGGGTTENVQFGEPVYSPYTHTFTMLNDSRDDSVRYNYTVALMMADYGSAGTCTGTYTVGPIPNNNPSIDDITWENGILTVYASDPEGDDMWATITEPAGLSADDTTIPVVDGVALFPIKSGDIIAGGSGVTIITVEDERGGIATAEFDITIDPIVIPDGALAVVPVMPSAMTDDVVTVMVISGTFSHPFQYMNGVGVTVNAGAAYEDGTYNVGVPGGGQMDIDGIWTSFAPDAFLLPNDFMIQENDIGGGLVRIDFNVTPIGGSDTTNGGALFNFGLSFNNAGTYKLGFEAFHDVKRTYYSDGASTEYNWDDISNDYPGVSNSVEVT
jgi:hypothetical protein